MDLIDIVLARGGDSGGGSGGDGGGVVILSVDPDTGLFNMTWREIANAALSGKVGFLVIVSITAPEDAQPGDYVVSTWTLCGVYRDENSGAYGVEFSGAGGASFQYYAETADDYPLYD